MFRVLVAVTSAAMTGLLVAAFTIGGFDVDDPQLEEALYWARDFSAERPDATPALAAECAAKLASSPVFTRDGAVQLFDCVRSEAEALQATERSRAIARQS
jgi:hypothetical protein